MSTYRKVSHVRDEDCGLDNLGQRGSGLGDDGLDILAALPGLFRDSALNGSSVGSKADLTRAVDGRRGLHALGLDSRFSQWVFSQ